MELSIKSLEQITSPLEITNLLGRPLTKVDNDYYTTVCPKCESKLFIIDKEFVCESNACTFRAGGVVDYVVAAEGCKWDNVVDVLNTILNGRLDNTTILKNKKQIGLMLKNKRRIFDLFLRVGLNGSINSIGSIQYKTAIRSQGIDPDLLRWSVFVFGHNDSLRLCELLTALDSSKTLELKGENIILPYFADHHTISHLVVLSNPVARPERVSVLPHRVSYFGLLQRHPECKHTKLAYSYADAAKLNTQYGKISPENICLHQLMDAKADGVAFTLAGAEYVITDTDNDDLRAVSIL